MDQQEFQSLMMPVMKTIAASAVDQKLATVLNETYPPDGEVFKGIKQACHAAIEAGWMCSQGPDGMKFGRVIDPGPETHDLSVDVVQLREVVGPHHSHPTGEVCMTMPMTPDAKFDGQGAGWCVNDPGSAHSPTVTDGEALALYLLPEGKIVFTR